MYPVSTSASVGLAQLQAYENGKGNSFTKIIVKNKIRSQMTLIKYFNKYHKTLYPDENEETKALLRKMDEIRKQVDAIPEDNLNVLRGVLFASEGRSAECYWQYIRKLLREKIDFEGRERKGAKDPVNSAFNYGYGMLYSRIWEAITRARLEPGLSYLHSPNDNKPSLSFDLIEEFRTEAVDRPVIAMIRKSHIPKVKDGFLTPESRTEVATRVLERLGRFETYHKRELRLHDIIMAQARALRDFLEGKTSTYKPYKGTW